MKLAVLRGLLNLGLSLVVLKQVLLREPGKPLLQTPSTPGGNLNPPYRPNSILHAGNTIIY